MNQHTPRGDQRFVLACLVAAFAAGYGAFGLIRRWRFEFHRDDWVVLRSK